MRMSPSTPPIFLFIQLSNAEQDRLAGGPLSMHEGIFPPARQSGKTQWLEVTKRNQRGRLQITRCSSLLGGLIPKLDSSVFNNRGVRLAVAFLGEACRCRAGPCSSTPRPRPHGLGDFLFFHSKLCLRLFGLPSTFSTTCCLPVAIVGRHLCNTTEYLGVVEV